MAPVATANAYAGDISVHQAWAMLQEKPEAVIVDVRTPEEWRGVGIVDLSALEKQPVCIAWRTLPGMKLNSSFASELGAALPDTEAPLLFLCKVGGRSQEAAIAMTQLGYTRCYNIAGGFEYGWQPNALPWKK